MDASLAGDLQMRRARSNSALNSPSATQRWIFAPSARCCSRSVCSLDIRRRSCTRAEPDRATLLVTCAVSLWRNMSDSSFASRIEYAPFGAPSMWAEESPLCSAACLVVGRHDNLSTLFVWGRSKVYLCCSITARIYLSHLEETHVCATGDKG